MHMGCTQPQKAGHGMPCRKSEALGCDAAPNTALILELTHVKRAGMAMEVWAGWPLVLACRLSARDWVQAGLALLLAHCSSPRTVAAAKAAGFVDALKLRAPMADARVAALTYRVACTGVILHACARICINISIMPG